MIPSVNIDHIFLLMVIDGFSDEKFWLVNVTVIYRKKKYVIVFIYIY